jgi:hypothetical protein
MTDDTSDRAEIYEGWRFRHIGAAQYAKLGVPEPLLPGRRASPQSAA